MSEAGTYEEWRVTGQPSGNYPPYDFTWSPFRNPHLGNPERGAKAFVEAVRSCDTPPWDDGPHLTRRTVEVSDWEAA